MKALRIILFAIIAFLVVAQFIRPDMKNPPVNPAKTLDATLHPPAHTTAILERACNDCHSSNTAFPWYSRVAPMSWLLANHIKDGRQELSFSQWGNYDARRQARKLQEICKQVKDGDMPLTSYTLLHPDAKLSGAERQEVCTWADGARAQIIAAHPEAAKPRSRT